MEGKLQERVQVLEQEMKHIKDNLGMRKQHAICGTILLSFKLRTYITIWSDQEISRENEGTEREAPSPGLGYVNST